MALSLVSQSRLGLSPNKEIPGCQHCYNMPLKTFSLPGCHQSLSCTTIKQTHSVRDHLLRIHHQRNEIRSCRTTLTMVIPLCFIHNRPRWDMLFMSNLFIRSGRIIANEDNIPITLLTCPGLALIPILLGRHPW